MGSFKEFPVACCGWFSYAIVNHFIWYNPIEEEWCADFYNNMDREENSMSIRYCPFCGTKLEKENDGQTS